MHIRKLTEGSKKLFEVLTNIKLGIQWAQACTR